MNKWHYRYWGKNMHFWFFWVNCHFKVSQIRWLIITIIVRTCVVIFQNIHREHHLFFGGLKSWRDGYPVWTRFHSQTKICAEVQLLPWNAVNLQPVEQRGEKDKHLQTCKSVTETASLPHAEDENLLRQLLVEESWQSQEAFRAKCFWVTPKITGTKTLRSIRQ